MKTTAVSELKASLSEFLAQVKTGEEVLITERGRPVAKIIPITREDQEIPSHLLALERAGLAKIGQLTIPDSFWQMRRPSAREGQASKALWEEREEGR